MRRITILLSLPVFALLLWYQAVTLTGTVVYLYPARIEVPPADVIAEAESFGVPMRITISSIAVDAAIEKVSLAKDGSMDVPKHPLDVAWYEPGPRPGEAGSAAIAGHVDDERGAAAVFANLHKVKPGDTIVVNDEKGAPTSFVVRESRKLAAAADATEVFTSKDGKAHLNLITCTGAWDARARQYAERLVVFADKVE